MHRKELPLNGSGRPFDQSHYESLNASRGEVVEEFLRQIAPVLRLESAVDVGCGLGHFSRLLSQTGLRVVGVEGRPENTEEARRRYPSVSFHTLNIEGDDIVKLGKFDLTLCLGLLYHLENPLRAVRNLRTITGKLLVAESVCYPHYEPLLGLVDEPKVEDQGLNFLAFYPSEACLVKMLYRAGFPNVYRFRNMPQHPDFRIGKNGFQVRTMLAASFSELPEQLLNKLPEPVSSVQPWINPALLPPRGVARVGHFLRKPLPQKFAVLKRIAGFRNS